MSTVVVNIKRQRYDVYIGRATSAPITDVLGVDGRYGNPVIAGATCPVCGGVHSEPGDTLPCFEVYFKRRIETDPQFAADVEGLRGLRLGCFCAPKRCHGDTYVAHLEADTDRQQALASLAERLLAAED